jgi:hypothetical protein
VTNALPEWLIQLTWFLAGLGGTGAIWYFLSQRRHRAAIASAIATVVLVGAAVGLLITNDHYRSQESLRARPLDHSPAVTNIPQRPPSPTLAQQEAALTSTAANFVPLTIDQYFDTWFSGAKTQLQRRALETRILGKRIIWLGVVDEVKEESGGGITVIAKPKENNFSRSVFLTFPAAQRDELVVLEPGQEIRFTGLVKSIVGSSPFLDDCRLLPPK